MIIEYWLSFADFVFEAVAMSPASVLQTQRLRKQVGAASLSLLLRIPNAAMYGATSVGCPLWYAAFVSAKCVGCF